MFRFEWLALVFLVGLTIASVTPPGPPKDVMVGANGCPSHYWTRDEGVAWADREYRSGDFAAAIARLQETRDFTVTPELQSLAELYGALGAADSTIDDKTASSIDVFVALRRAQSLDMSLGGVHATRFNALMRDVAPAAAAAYEAARDTAGAALAHHTAAMFR